MVVASSSSSTAAARASKRGPKGICARGVSTSGGVVPLSVALTRQPPPPALAARANPLVPMPTPLGALFAVGHQPADRRGPCNWCLMPLPLDADAAAAADEEAGDDEEATTTAFFTVIKATGRGCPPVGHGVFCSRACTCAALFRHPAFRHWDATDRFVSLRSAPPKRDERDSAPPPPALVSALFADSPYHAGLRTTELVRTNRYQVPLATASTAERAATRRAELLAFMGFQ